ncbi:hypothetical protein V3C99_012573 [Haemonchus contortus]
MSDATSSDGEKKPNGSSSADNGNESTDPQCNGNSLPRSDFVIVSDGSGEPLELPTAPDNTLFMTTLQSSFPLATGIKYKNAKTGASRAVAVDATGTKLLPPQDGWDDKTFIVITSSIRAGKGSDVSVKRRKIGTSDEESDSDGEGRVGRKRAADARDSVNGPAAPRRPVDLIVLGVSFKTTDEGFKKYFESFGTVSFAEIKRTVEGSSKGFGFVQMSTLEEQEKVLSVAVHMIDGRRCEIRIPDRKHDEYGFLDRSAPPAKALVNKIFVGRLLDKINEDILREFFEKEAKQIMESASVTDVFIPKPFRGFAFVTFTEPEVAEKMVKANNYVIDDMPVIVTLAVPREEAYERQNRRSGPPGYYNDFGYGHYGYGKSGAGYGRSPRGAMPYHMRDTFDYSAPGAFARSPYGEWSSPPRRPARGLGRAHEQPWNGPAETIPSIIRPAPEQQRRSLGLKPPPNMCLRDPRDRMNSQATSNQVANGLDALDLNQKDPNLMTAAVKAFLNTLSHGAAPSQPLKWF